MSLNANDAEEILHESGTITSHSKSIVIPLWEVSLEKSGPSLKVPAIEPEGENDWASAAIMPWQHNYIQCLAAA